MIKPSLPKGTRDFPAPIMKKRSYILQTIREVFELAGFQPLETPAMENLDTLTGKYGEEGDQLLFKILDNGDILERSRQARGNRELIGLLSEKALRYDLTIPFARYVVMHQQDLVFPFKRYQIQPVWRADRPQKGRYREFVQCDADIVGSKSLLNEAELVRIYTQIFTKLRIPGVSIRFNHRGLLKAFQEWAGISGPLTELTTAMDKLDKIGIVGVLGELERKGQGESSRDRVREFLSQEGDNESRIAYLKERFAFLPAGMQAIRDLEFLLDFDPPRAGEPELRLDLALARGLNYYTGTLFEVKSERSKVGSLGGGGRYDDLTGFFGVPNLSGVGISLGVDRIFDTLEDLDLFPPSAGMATRVLFLNLGEPYLKQAYRLVQSLREGSLPAELYPESIRMDKQIKYADRKGIPFVAILGEQEASEGRISIKDLRTGHQEILPLEKLAFFPF